MLPVTFGALDGEASWRDEEGRDVGPHRLAALHPEETTRPALFTALRTGFADPLLREAFTAVRRIRAARRQERNLPAGASARGLGKMLVVAPDQAVARRYHVLLQGWLPPAQAGTAVQLATSDTPRAHEILAAFRLTPEPSILVTVAMAELEAALGWLERNRLADQLHLLDGDPRYAWAARKRGEWAPPVGRAPGRKRGSASTGSG